MQQQCIGLMSGTSLDGIDAALVSFDTNLCTVIDTFYLPYPDEIKQALLNLHEASSNELEESQLVSNKLAQLYAAAVLGLLNGKTGKICAIGCHGQTIRHRPEFGFSLQLNNPSLLAELTGILVIADFRSRDIAAGGQGAPLVPAFHQAVFGHPTIHRVIVNIGGISNLTDLPPDGIVTGFDCGPGNLLMDAWCNHHTGHPYDRDGQWAAGGEIIDVLLEALLKHPFFRQKPPKSTGRDTFNVGWLEQQLLPDYAAQDVQATLNELSVRSIADTIIKYCPGTEEVYLCGGGAHNLTLKANLQVLLPHLKLAQTDELGIAADWVEAAAFAWLAKQTMEGKPGNLPAVTGASGLRVLGAIYSA
jgi:anhydro-N-acetylmuramic acid kinase